MNAWGLLYESLQSALIDSLNNRYPLATPELGLPFVRPRWDSPATPNMGASHCWSAAIKLEGASGHGVLCLLAQEKLVSELWPEFLNLAASEVRNRSERSRTGARMSLELGESNHTQGAPDWGLFGQPSRVVWTPLRMQTEEPPNSLFLGMGISLKT
jgi:hypothetical protein